MFPAVIYDDFFENPDLVVDLANSLEFEMGDGAWPGTRTKELGEIKGARSFADSVTDKVLRMFYPDKQYHYFAKRVFQKIKGFHEDQFHIKNRGWIHKDSGRAIGGIIYLDKEPEEETGTSLYRNKQLVFPHTHEEDSLKRRWYTGQDVSDEEHEMANDEVRELFNQYVEKLTESGRQSKLIEEDKELSDEDLDTLPCSDTKH